YEDPEGGGFQDQLEEQWSWNPEQGKVGLGRSHGGGRRLPQKRHHRDDAALPRVQTVQENLLSVRTALRGPDHPLDQQGILNAGASLPEELASRLHLKEPGRLFDLLEQVRGQFPEHRITAKEFFPKCLGHKTLPGVLIPGNTLAGVTYYSQNASRHGCPQKVIARSEACSPTRHRDRLHARQAGGVPSSDRRGDHRRSGDSRKGGGPPVSKQEAGVGEVIACAILRLTGSRSVG